MIIGTVLSWCAGSRRALAALRWGVVALTVCLLLLSVHREGSLAPATFGLPFAANVGSSYKARN